MATYAKQVDFLNVPQFDPTTNLRYQNGYVKVLEAGTSTKATVYTARDKGSTTTNPFALDSDDTKEIFLDGTFDIELYEGDPDDIDNPGVKRDTISGVTYSVLDIPSSPTSGGVVTWDTMPHIDIRLYGAAVDGVTDDSSAVQDVANHIKSLLTAVKDLSSYIRFRFFYDQPTIFFPPGVTLIQNTITVWSGTRLEFAPGAVLRAGTAGMVMIKTAESSANITDLGVFAAKNVKFDGGIIDGNLLANKGILMETCAVGCDMQDTVVGFCTGSKYSFTANIVADSPTVSSVSPFPSDIEIGDVLHLGTDANNLRMVINYDEGAGTITLASGSLNSGTGVTVTNRAAGIVGRMWQQSTIKNVRTMNNSVGSAIGRNLTGGGDNFNSTNLAWEGGISEDNEYCGILLDGCSGSYFSTTPQHTERGPEFICTAQSFCNWIDIIYIESLSDAEFTAIGNLAQMQTVPMIWNEGGNCVYNIRWPNNSDSLTWRRLMFNKGLNCTVENLIMTIAAMNENPSRAGDIAPFEQDISTGHIWVKNLRPGTTLTDMDKAVIFSDGSYNPSSSRVKVNSFINTLRNTGEEGYVCNTNSGPAVSAKVKGDSFDRTRVFPGSIYFGDGTAAADTGLGRSDTGIVLLAATGAVSSFVGGVAYATTTQLEDVSHAINTVGKFTGRVVVNTTTGLPLYAGAAAAAGVWKKFSDDTTAHTPV